MSFCKTHGIVKELKIAVELAEKCFQPVSLRIEMDIDPEIDDAKALIFLVLRKQPDQEVIAAYREFRRQEVKMLSRAKSGFIRLAF